MAIEGDGVALEFRRGLPRYGEPGLIGVVCGVTVTIVMYARYFTPWADSPSPDVQEEHLGTHPSG